MELHLNNFITDNDLNKIRRHHNYRNVKIKLQSEKLYWLKKRERFLKKTTIFQKLSS
jgi:hypothetical protein